MASRVSSPPVDNQQENGNPVYSHKEMDSVESCSAAQAGVQWCKLSSLQPLLPGFTFRVKPIRMSRWRSPVTMEMSGPLAFCIPDGPTWLASHANGSNNDLHHFGKARWADHLRSGVRDQPDQHRETPSLLKILN
ncbi:hypothetical protein AAY473_015097 [Plecturocebus cupreus]